MTVGISGGEFLGHPNGVAVDDVVEVAADTGQTLQALGLAEPTYAPVTMTKD